MVAIPGRFVSITEMEKKNAHDSRRVLLVLPSGQRRSALLSCLQSLGLSAAAVDNCHAARECIATSPGIDIVITQVSLRDGNWCDILSWVVKKGVDARVVVSSAAADERFWSEALWRGVYDVLVEPYEQSEISRIVGGALRAVSHPYTRNQPAAVRA